ncbi:hypothetical protein A2U01_0072020, partial [Trifolium medium]|nr:hypothetical protein [Trifolium medium]
MEAQEGRRKRRRAPRTQPQPEPQGDPEPVVEPHPEDIDDVGEPQPGTLAYEADEDVDGEELGERDFQDEEDAVEEEAVA